MNSTLDFWDTVTVIGAIIGVAYYLIARLRSHWHQSSATSCTNGCCGCNREEAPSKVQVQPPTGC